MQRNYHAVPQRQDCLASFGAHKGFQGKGPTRLRCSADKMSSAMRRVGRMPRRSRRAYQSAVWDGGRLLSKPRLHVQGSTHHPPRSSERRVRLYSHTMRSMDGLVPRWRLSSHHGASCPALPATCLFGKEECAGVTRGTLQTHMAEDCPFVMVQCSWSDLGCKHRDLRGEMIEHETSKEGQKTHGNLVREQIQRLKDAERMLPTGMTLTDAVTHARSCISVSSSSSSSLSSPSPSSSSSSSVATSTSPIRTVSSASTTRVSSLGSNLLSSSATLSSTPSSSSAISRSSSPPAATSSSSPSSSTSSSYVNTAIISLDMIRALPSNASCTQLGPFSSVAELTDIDACYAARRCPNLRFVWLSRCSLSNAFIEELAQSCPHLKELDISYSIQSTALNLYNLARRCVILKDVNFTGCLLQDDAVETFARHCLSSLTHVTMDDCPITDKAIAALAKHCDGITHLSVRNCARLTGDSLSVLAKHPSSLQVLDITGCKNISFLSKLFYRSTWPDLRDERS
eukprot:TRINITY_DN11821_c0_g1_i1.p1 TRINITY_DN11821_c0_g1~~TRINITY_DN11821_c0_g1_i1.p1  ORF type:complete len:513 (+),score=93.32 TRINITY_DN11821_c0_g1_i1:261-1799(+)